MTENQINNLDNSTKFSTENTEFSSGGGGFKGKYMDCRVNGSPSLWSISVKNHIIGYRSKRGWCAGITREFPFFYIRKLHG